MNNALKTSSRLFGIGLFCAALAFLSPLATPLQYLVAQMSTYTTLAQLPTTSPGGAFNLLSDSPAMAYNVDSHGTRNWFLSPVAITPITTANWTTLGASGTRTNGTNYINIVGTTGGSGNVYGVRRTVPAGDFTHYIAIQGIATNQNNSEIMVGFTDGTKVEGCGIESNGASNTGSTVISDIKTTALAAGTYNVANGNAGRNLYGFAGPIIIVKLTRVGAVYTCSVSTDGGVTYPGTGIVGFSDSTPFLTASSLAVWSDARGSANASVLTLLSSTLQ